MRFRLLPLAMITLALVLSASSAAQTARRSDWSGFKSLTLEVSFPKESYLQLQPIPVILTLSNKTTNTLHGHSGFHFGAGYARGWVRFADAEWREINDLSPLLILLAVDPREMKPNDQFTETQLLALKLEKIFPQPGTYQIKFRLVSGDGSQSVWSEPATIRINKPEGADLEAYNFLHKNTNPDFFFTGLRLSRDGRDDQLLDTFVAMFGETAYGDDATFLLAQRHFAKGERHMPGGDLETARVLFEKLANKTDFALAKKAKEYLRQVEKKQKE